MKGRAVQDKNRGRGYLIYCFGGSDEEKQKKQEKREINYHK
jgi:hypothetical protein